MKNAVRIGALAVLLLCVSLTMNGQVLIQSAYQSNSESTYESVEITLELNNPTTTPYTVVVYNWELGIDTTLTIPTSGLTTFIKNFSVPVQQEPTHTIALSINQAGFTTINASFSVDVLVPNPIEAVVSAGTVQASNTLLLEGTITDLYVPKKK